MAIISAVNSQSINNLTINPYWISRGLDLVFLGDREIWSRRGKFPFTRSGVPKSVNYPPIGDVVGFGTTYGSGTTDILDGGLLFRPLSGWRSIVSFYMAASSGGASFGRVFQDKNTNGVQAGETLFTRLNKLTYIVNASTHYGAWSSTTDIVTGTWQSGGLLHDQRTVAVTPIFYINGKADSATVVDNASGSYQSDPITLRWGNDASAFAVWDGYIGTTLIFDGYLTPAEFRILGIDPLAVFTLDSSFLYSLFNVSSVVNGNASGAVPSSLTLIATTGVSTGGASLIAPFSDELDFTIPTITGTGGASCSGSPSFLSLTAVTGSAVATGDAIATGSLSELTMTPVTADATGSANIIGSLSDELDFTVITGTAFSSVAASGSLDELYLTAPTGSASNETIGSGSLSELSFTNVLGNGFGSSSASGNMDELNFDSIIGSAVGDSAGIGSLSFLSFTTITGFAEGVDQHDATASGSISSLSLSAPHGSAAELAVIEDESEYILVYSKGSGIRYVPVTPGARKILSSM